MLNTIDQILSARSVEDAWAIFVRRLGEYGFPHLQYFGHRILRARDEQLILDVIELSSLPEPLTQELSRENLARHLPMIRWITRNHGSQSWSWMRQRMESGRLGAAERRAYQIFIRHGHGAGMAISLSDRVPRVRSGMLLTGRLGMTQSRIDALWKTARHDIELLSGVLHQRLANLPFRNPDQILTLRQREALELTGLGFTTLEIAARLDITQATVEKHLRLARQSLGARNTAHAVLLAMSCRQIFVDTGEPCLAPPGQSQATGDPRYQPNWNYRNFAVPEGANLPVPGQ